MTGLLDPGLYIVATPIGNLGDLSPRACNVLSQADLIAAEDTRHTQKLLATLGVKTPMVSYHDGNEEARTAQLLTRLQQQQSIALVSDAGTPLINDPGYRLVLAARQAGFNVRAIPGPSALTAALSIAGVPTNRFIFEGFLPERAKARRDLLDSLKNEIRTLVFFEAPHRIKATLADMNEIFGPERELAVLREISKRFESGYFGSTLQLAALSQSDPEMARGEIVILVRGVPKASAAEILSEDSLLQVLHEDLGVAQGSRIGARLTGISRRTLYQRMLSWQQTAQKKD